MPFSALASGLEVVSGFGLAARRDLVEAEDATRAHGVFYDIHGGLLLGRQLQHCLGELNLRREVLMVWKVFVVGGTVALAAWL